MKRKIVSIITVLAVLLSTIVVPELFVLTGSPGNVMASVTREWDEPGAINLNKTPKAADGDAWSFDVTLTIEGKNIIRNDPASVVLVFDTSGSMGTGYGSQYNNFLPAAKTAAITMIDSLLPDSQSKVQISLVNYASDVKENTDFYTFSNKQQLISKINGLSANGGTNIQAGLKAARDKLATVQTGDKYVILLSDGEPTYSYKATAGKAHTWATGFDNYALTAFNYNTQLGVGSYYDLRYITTDWRGREQTVDESYSLTIGGSSRKIENHGVATISEALLAREAGNTIYSINLGSANGTNQYNVLRNCATDAEHFLSTDGEGLQAAFARIAGEILYAAKDVVVTDVMGPYFAYVPGSYTIKKAKPDEEGKAIPGTEEDITASTLQPTTRDSDGRDVLTWTLGVTVEEGWIYLLTYRVTVPQSLREEVNAITDPDIGDPLALFDTNEYAIIDYTDVDDNKHVEQFFPEPAVPLPNDRGTILLFGYLVNADGEPVKSDGVTVVERPDLAYHLDPPGQEGEPAVNMSNDAYGGTIFFYMGHTYTVGRPKVDASQYIPYGDNTQSVTMSDSLHRVYFKYRLPNPNDYVKVTFKTDGNGTINDVKTDIDYSELLPGIDFPSIPETEPDTGYTFDGWYYLGEGGTSDAVKVDDFPAKVTENAVYEARFVPRKDLSYVVEYREGSLEGTELLPSKTVEDVTFGVTYTEDAEVIAGYTVDAAEKDVTIAVTENKIVFIYTARADLSYTVEYYYDGLIDNTQTETVPNRTFKEQITTYTEKPIHGYAFEKTENFPLTISANESENVIKVYYLPMTEVQLYKYFDGTSIGAAISSIDNISFTISDAVDANGNKIDESLKTAERLNHMGTLQHGITEVVYLPLNTTSFTINELPNGHTNYVINKVFVGTLSSRTEGTDLYDYSPLSSDEWSRQVTISNVIDDMKTGNSNVIEVSLGNVVAPEYLKDLEIYKFLDANGNSIWDENEPMNGIDFSIMWSFNGDDMADIESKLIQITEATGSKSGIDGVIRMANVIQDSEVRVIENTANSVYSHVGYSFGGNTTMTEMPVISIRDDASGDPEAIIEVEGIRITEESNFWADSSIYEGVYRINVANTIYAPLQVTKSIYEGGLLDSVSVPFNYFITRPGVSEPIPGSLLTSGGVAISENVDESNHHGFRLGDMVTITEIGAPNANAFPIAQVVYGGNTYKLADDTYTFTFEVTPEMFNGTNFVIDAIENKIPPVSLYKYWENPNAGGLNHALPGVEFEVFTGVGNDVAPLLNADGMNSHMTNALGIVELPAIKPGTFVTVKEVTPHVNIASLSAGATKDDSDSRTFTFIVNDDVYQDGVGYRVEIGNSVPDLVLFKFLEDINNDPDGRFTQDNDPAKSDTALAGIEFEMTWIAPGQTAATYQPEKLTTEADGTLRFGGITPGSVVTLTEKTTGYTITGLTYGDARTVYEPAQGSSFVIDLNAAGLYVEETEVEDGHYRVNVGNANVQIMLEKYDTNGTAMDGIEFRITWETGNGKETQTLRTQDGIITLPYGVMTGTTVTVEELTLGTTITEVLYGDSTAPITVNDNSFTFTVNDDIKLAQDEEATIYWVGIENKVADLVIFKHTDNEVAQEGITFNMAWTYGEDRGVVYGNAETGLLTTTSAGRIAYEGLLPGMTITLTEVNHNGAGIGDVIYGDNNRLESGIVNDYVDNVRSITFTIGDDWYDEEANAFTLDIENVVPVLRINKLYTYGEGRTYPLADILFSVNQSDLDLTNADGATFYYEGLPGDSVSITEFAPSYTIVGVTYGDGIDYDEEDIDSIFLTLDENMLVFDETTETYYYDVTVTNTGLPINLYKTVNGATPLAGIEFEATITEPETNTLRGEWKQTVRTDANGYATFYNIMPDSRVTVREVTEGYRMNRVSFGNSLATDGRSFSFVADENLLELLTETPEYPNGGIVIEVDNTPYGTLTINKWLDSNGNGIWDAGEGFFPDSPVVVFNVTGPNGYTGQITIDGGSGKLYDLPMGAYTITEEVPTGYTMTGSTSPLTFTLNYATGATSYAVSVGNQSTGTTPPYYPPNTGGGTSVVIPPGTPAGTVLNFEQENGVPVSITVPFDVPVDEPYVYTFDPNPTALTTLPQLVEEPLYEFQEERPAVTIPATGEQMQWMAFYGLLFAAGAFAALQMSKKRRGESKA